MTKIMASERSASVVGTGPRQDKVPAVPMLAWKDLRTCLLLLLSLPISWLVPERWWPVAGRLFARVRQAIKRDRVARTKHIEAVAGDRRLAMAPGDAADRRIAHDFVERLQMLRCYRPGGWTPAIQLEGREYLDQAVASGSGTILWFMPSSYSTSVSKMAVGAVGVPLRYLSRFTHNLSATWWGARLLNPIRMGVENRYLAERLVIRPGTERETFAAMKTRLSDGATVGVTVNRTGRRIQDIPFLNGHLRLATAPAALSVQLGVRLIPVTTARREDGSFIVTVHAPLTVPDPDDLAGSIEKMLLQYGDLAASYALSHPDQFWWQDVIRK